MCLYTYIVSSSWPNDYNFGIDESHSILFPNDGCLATFRVVNDYEETVCHIDLNTRDLIFCPTTKSDSYKKNAFQSINCDGQVFLASTEDRSCAMFDVSTGFLKYVEENPLFPTYRSFSLTRLDVPARLADCLLPNTSSII